MFENDPMCDLCLKLYASDELDPSSLPLHLRHLFGKPDEYEVAEGELLCSGCFELLRIYAHRLRNLTTIKELKVVRCPVCAGRSRPCKRYGPGGAVMPRCRTCRGTRQALAMKSALERLADAAE